MNKFEEALLRYLSRDDLAKIQNVRIGIAGAGGLGSNAAQMLVRTGFKNLKIVDFDVVEPSNLNRQFYFFTQLGQKKVEALKENLKRINPDVYIAAVAEKIDSQNVQKIFLDCSVVVEAFDKAEYKKLLVETYLKSDKLLVSASGLAGWGDSDRLKVHKVRDNFILVGDLVSGIDSSLPPLSPCVNIAAAKEADEVVSFVLGKSNNKVRGS